MMKKKFKILELFAGIGACSKALTNLSIEHEIVDAVGIDKYAIASFNAIHNTNFKPTDICSWDKDIDVDLITHGSPCQDFSVAGKQVGGDNNSGTRSSLMYETIRIIGKLRPKFVIWENVKNLLSAKHKHNFDNYITTLNALGYISTYKVLNAKDYGIPQNRERVFTISIRKDIDYKFHFPTAKPLEIRLKDVLELDVDQKYYIPQEKVLKILNSSFSQEKSRLQEKGVCDTLLARDYKDPKCVQVGELNIKGQDCIKSIYSPDGLSPTLTTMGGGNRQPKIAYGIAMRGRYNRDGKVEQKIEPSGREIANTITTVQKDSMVGEIKGNDLSILQRPHGYNKGKQLEICPTITSNCFKENNFVQEKMTVRKLTPKECWRLMGFDDQDFENASRVNSNSQLYKQAGNSIVVNVLMEIFRSLFKEDER